MDGFTVIVELLFVVLLSDCVLIGGRTNERK